MSSKSKIGLSSAMETNAPVHALQKKIVSPKEDIFIKTNASSVLTIKAISKLAFAGLLVSKTKFGMKTGFVFARRDM